MALRRREPALASPENPFTHFNSALTAGLLSPPLQTQTRSSPTLFEMMASEPDPIITTTNNNNITNGTTFQNNNQIVPVQNTHNLDLQKMTVQQKLYDLVARFNDGLSGDVKVTLSSKEGFSVSINVHKQNLDLQKTTTQQKLYDLVACKSPGSRFNDALSGDVKLTISSKEGFSVSINVHKQVLVSNSKFFATKLEDRGTGMFVVEIADCDDIEVYVETLRLMYSRDLRRRLMKEDVCKVLGVLKVSAAIGFNAGVLSCLEYLEAAPWAEDEEEKVASLLSELQLEGAEAGEVLKRVSNGNNTTNKDKNGNEEVLLKLLHVVLEGKDEKARREMKGLVLKMLRENASQNDLRRESLYSACDGCLKSLHDHFLRAAEGDLKEAAQVARQADNLHWILDIMIDRQIADVFLKTWASQTELSDAHSRVPVVHRYEISRVTARLFVGVGKGQLLASKEARCLLLQTWLVPFYEDFGWMRRAAKGLDRHLVEEGLSNTILTLPLSWQQEIFMSWFDRFLNGGDDCPNMQRGFEVWWRRAFWKRNGEQPERPRQMRISNDNS